MTAAERDRSEEQGYDKPVVHDKRRIDPVTGKVRQAVDAPEAPVPSPSDDGAVAGAGTGTRSVEDEDALTKAQAEALDLADQLARRNADVYNVQQEYNAYVRRSKADAAAQREAGAQDVAEALLGVLDDIELARQHGDLTGPFSAIAEKLEGVLAARFQVTRYGEVGEEFDPAVHEALMHSTDPEASTTTVTQVLQPGYRAGERVLRAARVAVSSPE